MLNGFWLCLAFVFGSLINFSRNTLHQSQQLFAEAFNLARPDAFDLAQLRERLRRTLSDLFQRGVVQNQERRNAQRFSFLPPPLPEPFFERGVKGSAGWFRRNNH